VPELLIVDVMVAHLVLWIVVDTHIVVVMVLWYLKELKLMSFVKIDLYGFKELNEAFLAIADDKKEKQFVQDAAQKAMEQAVLPTARQLVPVMTD
jgi:hypothetical protein